ncbi:transposase [Thermus scotoductus]|uniref:Transposase n=2 Tax=Thermus scotoductus TaxID=37636 RepID=A0A430S137_THESC|nr:transposase [Thermus scotoductus]RTI40963.1 transposase [Thermus scotoductus]
MLTRPAPLFGDVVDGEMRLNEYGEIVRAEWFKTVQLRPYVVLHEDEFVVMPNHIHGMIWIVDDVGATRRVAPTKTNPPAGPAPGSIGAIVGAFKSAVTRRINQRRGTPGVRVWQRNYYEHIIRHERALNAIRRYIAENPLRWHLDRYNPHATGTDPQAQEIWQMMKENARTVGRRAPTGGQS